RGVDRGHRHVDEALAVGGGDGGEGRGLGLRVDVDGGATSQRGLDVFELSVRHLCTPCVGARSRRARFDAPPPPRCRECARPAGTGGRRRSATRWTRAVWARACRPPPTTRGRAASPLVTASPAARPTAPDA